MSEIIAVLLLVVLHLMFCGNYRYIDDTYVIIIDCLACVD